MKHTLKISEIGEEMRLFDVYRLYSSNKQNARTYLPFRDFFETFENYEEKSVSDIRDALGLGQSQFGLRLAGRQTHRLGFLHY